MQVGPSEESVSNFPLSKGDWAPRLDFFFNTDGDDDDCGDDGNGGGDDGDYL